MTQLRARAIAKAFPGVRALAGVDFDAAGGELVALIGENGAGKSTLMRCLCGVHRPDAGTITLDGAPVAFGSPRDAHRAGVRLIHQEPSVLPNLSVAANLYLGEESARLGLLREGAMRTGAQATLRRLGTDLDPATMVGALSPAAAQLVEIARALHARARVLFLDEPTSSLSERETARLFAALGDLRASGVAIVYVTHRLAEVERIADRVVVLRDGRNAGALGRAQITRVAMERLMVGRELAPRARAPRAVEAPAVLEVRSARTSSHPQRPVSFTLRAGELVGLGGLVGSGRTELARALFGITPLVGGEVRVGGTPVRLRSARDALRAGIALAPEDRALTGLVLALSVRANLALPHLRRLARAGLVRRRAVDELARSQCERFGIRTASIAQPAATLSGGNQQKLVLARWLWARPRVLILDEPTRGVDVGARAEIQERVAALRAEGLAVLWISSDLPELFEVSDRVLVMHAGAIAGELGPDHYDEQRFIALATAGARP